MAAIQAVRPEATASERRYPRLPRAKLQFHQRRISICGTTVVGEAHFFLNAAPIQIGSANPLLCAGNKFGQSVLVNNNTNTTLVFNNTFANSMQVMGNTGIVDVVNNVLAGNLTCSGIFAMSGGNTAKQFIGACH
jgi:hypothetical protein